MTSIKIRLALYTDLREFFQLTSHKDPPTHSPNKEMKSEWAHKVAARQKMQKTKRYDSKVLPKNCDETNLIPLKSSKSIILTSVVQKISQMKIE